MLYVGEEIGQYANHVIEHCKNADLNEPDPLTAEEKKDDISMFKWKEG